MINEQSAKRSALKGRVFKIEILDVTIIRM